MEPLFTTGVGNWGGICGGICIAGRGACCGMVCGAAACCGIDCGAIAMVGCPAGFPGGATEGCATAPQGMGTAACCTAVCCAILGLLCIEFAATYCICVAACDGAFPINVAPAIQGVGVALTAFGALRVSAWRNCALCSRFLMEYMFSLLAEFSFHTAICQNVKFCELMTKDLQFCECVV